MNRKRKALLLSVSVIGLITLGAWIAWGEGGWETNQLSPVELTKPKIYTKENAPAVPKLEELPSVDSVTQYGITWKFKTKAPVGRFINGDYYVVGPVIVEDINPQPIFGDQVKDVVNQFTVNEGQYKPNYARNGSTLNYPCTKNNISGFGGFDSRHAKDHYRAELFAPLPISMNPGDALISSISRPSSELKLFNGKEYELKVLAVLTCLKEPVPPDAFRPSYCDRQQTIFLARDIHRELLHTLPKPGTAPENLDYWVRKLQLPWIDISTFGFISAWENQPRYGQYYSNMTSIVSLLLMLDYTPEQKEPLLINYLQYGIDLRGIVRAGYPGWYGIGGYGGGRLWTILFAGLLLDDKGMQQIRTSHPQTHFGEIDQTAFGKHWMGYDTVFRSHLPNMNESPELRHPSKWTLKRDGYTSEGYRRCCTSKEWPGQALVARMMQAEKFWAHDAFFAYVDRWMTEDKAKMGQLIEEAARGQFEGDKKAWGGEERFNTIIGGLKGASEKDLSDPFQLDMWKTYRNNLPSPRNLSAGTKQ